MASKPIISSTLVKEFNVVLPLDSTSTKNITFHVKDNNGNYVVGATVELSGYGTKIVSESSPVVIFTVPNTVNSFNYRVEKLQGNPLYSTISETIKEDTELDLVINVVLEQATEDIIFTIYKDSLEGDLLDGANVTIRYSLDGFREIILTDVTVYGKCIFKGIPISSLSSYGESISEESNIKFTITKDGYESKEGFINVQEDPNIALVSVSSVTGDVIFTITDTNGFNIEDARVELFGEGVKYTNSSGIVTFQDVLAGAKYSYNISKIGYSTVTGEVLLSPWGNSVNITKSLAADLNDLNITVIGENEEPIVEARVRLYNIYGELLKERFTDINGFCQIANLAAQTLILETDTYIHLTNRRTFVMPENDYTLRVILKLPILNVDLEGVFQNPKEADPSLTNDSKYPVNGFMADRIVNYVLSKYREVPSDTTSDNKHNPE